MKTIKWERGVELPECDYFSAEQRDIESLHHTDIGECVFEYLDSLDKDDLLAILAENGKIEVTLHIVNKVPRSRCKFLERLIEDLDDTFASKQECTLTETELKDLITLEQAFIGEVLSRYRPGTCSEILSVTIPVADWLDAHQEDREGLDL